MRLYTKLLLGFGSLWCIFLVATVMALILLQQQSRSLEDVYHSNLESVFYCEQMIESLDELNHASVTSILDQTAPDPDALAAVQRRFNDAAEGQRHNITQPGEAELTETLFQLAGDYQDTARRFTLTLQSLRVYQTDLLPRYAAARKAAQAVSGVNLESLRSLDVRLRQNLQRARILQIAFVFTGAAFALASILVLAKTILGPLRALTESAHEVEAGNLDQVVPVRARDELGELAAAFNAMAAKLREYRQLDHVRLQRTQRTTQQAIDSLPDAVFVLNPQGYVEISNHQAQVHFGMVPGRHDLATSPVWLRQLVAGPLTTGTPVEPRGYQSAVQLFDNGEERFLLPRAVPMFADDNKVIGVVVTLVDVTRLHRADELKSGMVATASHELKTPLAATRFSVHLLAQDNIGALTVQQRKLVKAACEGADRLHFIIENLLQFQRFEEGRQRIQLATISPETLAQQAVGPLLESFTQAGLSLVLQISKDLPLVSADPDLIGHVLTNLLSNALKFVPRGGQITVFAIAQHPHVLFHVADNGPGIPPDHLPKLFTRFYRATAPADTPGAGLGLAIAKQIVEAHCGQIYAEHTPGGGVTFSFALRQAMAIPETSGELLKNS